MGTGRTYVSKPQRPTSNAPARSPLSPSPSARDWNRRERSEDWASTGQENAGAPRLASRQFDFASIPIHSRSGAGAAARGRAPASAGALLPAPARRRPHLTVLSSPSAPMRSPMASTFTRRKMREHSGSSIPSAINPSTASTIATLGISDLLNAKYVAQHYWPAPLIQLNPSFVHGKTDWRGLLKSLRLVPDPWAPFFRWDPF
jgi:hypothetical protein